jgi:MoxR-like ATPase
MLGQPLLLTGEPGTGKTHLAWSVAWELGLGEPLKFETKSTSSSRELFYEYDHLSRFHAANTDEGSQRSIDYVTFSALGMAILLANEPDEVVELKQEQLNHDSPRRSVVLIDEIDKAPRDFPNDILNEIEGMYFRIPELKNIVVTAAPEMHPVVIITSNSEKHLPDAFLRRCVYYNIEFPDSERLEEIILSQLGWSADEVSGAFDLFFRLRDYSVGLRKKPGTAELLYWFCVLRTLAGGEVDIRQRPELVESTLGCLVKNSEDTYKARNVVREWSQTK